MHNLKAQATLKHIKKEMKSEQGSSIPNLVRLINTLSLNIHELPIYKLTDLIQNDPVIFQKILSAANRVMYNPASAPISTINGAIHMIGFERVRSLTMAMMLLETTEKTAHSEKRKHAALLSVSAGLVTREFAKSTHSKINPDIAFICGALRGYGELILTTYMPEKTIEAQEYSKDLSKSEAYRKAFGLSPLEFTHELMKESKLPHELLDTLVEHSPKSSPSQTKKITAISDLGFQLAEISFDQNIDAQTFDKKIAALSKAHEQTAYLGPETFELKLQETHNYISNLQKYAGSNAFPKVAFKCLEARMAKEDPPEPEIFEAINEKSALQGLVNGDGTQPLSKALKKEEEVSQGLSGDDTFWDEKINAMEQFDQAEGLTPQAINQLFEILGETFRSSEIWLFLPQNNSQDFHFFRGTGTYQLFLKNNVKIKKTDRSIFGLCLRRKEIIVINDTKNNNVKAYLPKWYLDNIDIKAFAACSLHENSELSGMIFIGWQETMNFSIQPEKAPLIQKVIAKAAKLSRRL